MKKYLSEFLGTFMLIFIGTGMIIIDDYTLEIGHFGICFSFGLTVCLAIYYLGNISGAHINPAVTIAFWVAKKFRKIDVLPYILFQILGAITASSLLFIIFPDTNTMGETIILDNNYLKTFILEFIITFILMFVILYVSSRSYQNTISGIAIGGTVFLCSFFVGPLTGASMNPARTIAPALFTNLEHIWIYITSSILGAIFSVFIINSKINPIKHY